MKAFISFLDSVYTTEKVKIEDPFIGTYVHLLKPDFYKKRQFKSMIVEIYRMLIAKIGKDNIINKLDNCRAGIIFSTGNATFGYPSKFKTTHELFKFQTGDTQLNSTHTQAGIIANNLEYFDYISSDCSACLSSGTALSTAEKLIKSGELDRVIIVALEDPIKPDLLEVFVGTKACATLEHDKNGKKISAFDSINGGFYFGQGGAIAIIENEKSLASTQRIPLFEIIDSTVNAERCSNPVGMTETGEGYKKAISTLMSRNALFPNDIDIIKSHGSGTPTNNKAEGTAILETFSDTAVKVISYKQYIGHTFGPSFLVELDMLCDDLAHGYLMPIANRTEQDKMFLSERTHVTEVKNILCLASGISNSFFGCLLRKV